MTTRVPTHINIATVKFVVSVRMGKTSAFSRWIFVKFGIWVFSKNLPGKLAFRSKLTRKMATLLEDRYTFFYRIFLQWEVPQTEAVEIFKTHIFVSSNIFHKILQFVRKSYRLWENHIVYEKIISFTRKSYRLWENHIVYEKIISFTRKSYRLWENHIFLEWEALQN